MRVSDGHLRKVDRTVAILTTKIRGAVITRSDAVRWLIEHAPVPDHGPAPLDGA